MLSETSTFKGGNTILRKGDGTSYICPLPPIGHAMILQGGQVTHAVSPTDSAQERISMVTSYRPTNPLVADRCFLKTVRTVSDTETLQKQWLDYRLRLLAERILKGTGSGQSVDSMSQFAKEQAAFLEESVRQIMDPVERIPTNTRGGYLDWREAQSSMVAV